MVTGNGLGRRLQAASETLFERPAAAREGGAIHVNGARGTRPTRPVSRSIRRPARARPEPVGRPLGEHGDERKRGSAKMPAGPERGLQQLCGIVPSFSLHVGLKRCSSSPCQAQTANPLKMHVVVPLRSRLRWVLRDLPTARCRADLGRCRPLWRSQKSPLFR